ncbi:MAG TPA: hypothetical protein VKQ32_11970 [Polyangia bacterium]|nr:hypothetical protein [Polyangia bacterium]
MTALLCTVAVDGCSKSAPTDGLPECMTLRACGSTTPAPATEVPPVHRSTAQACSPTAAAANPGWPYDATGTPCTSDAQCTTDAGQTGTCLHGACTVDGCLTDDDCAGGGVCVCSSPVPSSAVQNRNTCTHGNCRVDADCGAGGYCVPSGGVCGLDGFFCHTPADTCVDAAKDCGTSCGGGCHYFSDKGAFACLAPICGGC